MYEPLHCRRSSGGKLISLVMFVGDTLVRLHCIYQAQSPYIDRCVSTDRRNPPVGQEQKKEKKKEEDNT